jgi:hypothetical protein
MTNNSNKNQGTYTAFIVRDANKRRFLTTPTYSGRVRGVWGLMNEATVFSTREEAQSCASNINSRRPEGYSAYFAQVRPITIRRRAR